MSRATPDLLNLNDCSLTPIDQPERTNLLEMLDDRTDGKVTLITSQLPVEHWYNCRNGPTFVDAILDRIVHRSHRLALEDESLRKMTAAPATKMIRRPEDQPP